MFAKNQIVFLIGLVFTLALGCGGAVEEPATTPEPVVTPEVSEPEPPPPVREQPIQRVDSPQDYKKCSVHDEEDGTVMVVSDENDWFLYVQKSAQVECGNFGGKVTIVDGPLFIMVKALIPQGDSGKKIEAELREKAVNYIKTDLAEKYGSGSHLNFKKSKLGKSKRPALCVDADLTMNGTPGRVVACVTSKKNINDEIVVHRVIWTGTKEEYDPKETVKTVKKAAAGWYRYSDTDGMGKLRIKW